MRTRHEPSCAGPLAPPPPSQRREPLTRLHARSPWLSDEQLARLPVAIRHKTVAGTLADIAEAATEASERGGFDGPETHVSRLALTVDEAGRAEIAALLDETRAAALRINAASATRQAEQSAEAPPPVATELGLIHLRQAKTT